MAHLGEFCEMLSEGASLCHPHLFKGDRYLFWKMQMCVHIESVNLELWELIENPHVYPNKNK